MKRSGALFLLALALLPLLIYLPVLKHELIWDSRPIILENDLLRGTFAPAAPFRSGYWSTTSQRSDGGYDYYRPLTILSFMIERAAWGLSPFRLRLTNLLLFIAALFVLYAFLRRQAGRPGAAEAAVLLFALFPLHVDNINWVVGRCDLLMLLFGLLSLLCLDIYLEKRSPGPGLLALAFFAAALLSKEAAIFFLPLFPLHELIRRRRLSLHVCILPLLAIAGFWLLKSAVIGRGGFPIRPFPGLRDNVLPLLGALGYYARSLVFPFRYDMFLPVAAVQTLPSLAAGGLAALMLALVPAGALSGGRLEDRRWQPLIGAWFWTAPFLGATLLMVFTPIYPFSISTRYLMVPAIGWTWLLGHWLSVLRPALKKAALASLLLLSAIAVAANSQKYGNEMKFWQSAYRSCPDDSFFLYKYAGQLRDAGDFVRGEILLRRALEFTMKSSTAVSISLQLAATAMAQARYAESLRWLDKAGSLPLPSLPAALRRSLLLRVHVARGDRAAAEAVLDQMERSQPPRETARMRIELDLAFADWPQALRAAAALGGAEASAWSRTIRDDEAAFLSFDPGRRVRFFIDRGNFAAAWTHWPGKEAAEIPDQLQTARLALLAGNEAEGRQRLARLGTDHGSDFRVLNAAGNLLFDLQRADEALPFYQRSLRLNPRQEALRQRLGWIQEARRENGA